MKNVLLIILLLIVGCADDKPEVTGLWELHKVDVDMIPRNFKPTFIQFERGGAFYVSKEEGDLTGLYQLNGPDLRLSSTDEKWFNRNWKVDVIGNELILNDPEFGFRIAQLRFKKVAEFPSFEEFQQTLNGNWLLYKMEDKGQVRKLSNTYFNIENETYQIFQEDQLIEEGRILVDTRHQKITFENSRISWDAHFVWDELRLENKTENLAYRLRKQ